MNTVVLFICFHQLHLGFWYALQPLSESIVLLMNLVLTSISLRLFERLYAARGGLLNARASLSLDRRKFQFLFAISAINWYEDYKWCLEEYDPSVILHLFVNIPLELEPELSVFREVL